MVANTQLLLSIEDLAVSFDGFRAVDGINLYLNEGELRVIIGPNGAGKTALLDLVCGKTRATEGSILFRDKQLRGMTENQIVHAGVGRKFQAPSIYESLSVFENLELTYPKGRNVIGSLFFRRTAEVEERIQATADMVGLGDRLEDLAGLLSHGQKQWLEIAMLLIQDPQLLMLDEPVAGMSQAERQQTAELLNRISQDRSVLIIEHDMKFVEQIASKVTVLDQGKVLAEGNIDRVKNDERVIERYLGH
ncbi:urea ABC transporter ATP-binding protein UrtD [Halovibrio salipaludis]|uniref:Urea ABC transporter ATP-binding protein UrtD n=1 Tax=Halovibrio salipaludis TaxID=2032626 RepID=A0A2A2EU17_9GAMM|nr:urea ABC transporter ATP-binding protein UrtD [Halovibrio salipaludis]PAU75852.1 urea ABC transporter ATP-binding protein UrtD [Halovibrio salipaludis]